MAFQKFDNFQQAKEAGIEYMLTVGRRQPMHIGHLATINKIMDNGVKPIIVIGSTNTATKQNGLTEPFFEPVSNPLTAEQQREQIKIALAGKIEGVDYHVVEFPDLGDNDKWCIELADILKGRIKIDGKFPDLSAKTAFHFFGKEIDKRPRRLVTGDGEEKEVLAYFWEGIFDKLGLPVLLDKAHEGVDANLSASSLRLMDLNNLTPEERALFAAPDYIIGLAKEARAKNGLPENVQLTTLDLSLQKLIEGKNIGIGQVKLVAQAKQGLNFGGIREAIRELNGSIKAEETRRLNIMTGAMNQTVYDYARNVPNIVELLKKAVAAKADMLVLPELALTGYEADDGHQWNKDNDTVWRQLEYIAQVAHSLDPNLVISIGAPWHHADKELDASDPLYNISNRPYNCQFTITGGKIVAVSAKQKLAVGAAEFENHQFRPWHGGTIDIKLPNGSKVPFGKPVIALGKDGKHITFYTEQCAEGWDGLNDDGTIIAREQNQARQIVALAQETPISVMVNPSGSKPQPAINKEKTRMVLCTSGSKHCGVVVYTNILGAASGVYAAEGSQIFAQDGAVIHHGERYSFENTSCTSITVDVPLAFKGKPHAYIDHNFTEHDMTKTGGEAGFEERKGDELVYEEYMRSCALWLRDYLEKQTWPAQGYLISLSGGKDSAYGAIATAYALELDIKSEGVEKFFERFPHLKCKEEALKIFHSSGEEKALEFIKHEMLTFIYLPGDNSSTVTKDGAQTLVEGVTLADGRKVKGIGGKFMVLNVQPVIEDTVIVAAGLDIKKAIQDKEATVTSTRAKLFGKLVKWVSKFEIAEGLYDGWMERSIRKEVKKYVMAKSGSNPVLPKYIADNCQLPIPTWADPKYDIRLQGDQAHGRQPIPWAVAAIEGKIPLTTSNASEASAGYSAAAADSHMGGANPICGIPKTTLEKSLLYFQTKGLFGSPPLEILINITKQDPSAELRPLVDGRNLQVDTKDLGTGYPQIEAMERIAITDRRTPQQAYEVLKGNNLFPSDPVELRNILVKFLDKQWAPNQFKRVMQVLGPYMGDNKDPHLSVRTTVLGDHFKTGLAHLTLHIISEKLGGADKFAEQVGVPLDEVKGIVERSRGLKQELTKVDCSLLNYSCADFGRKQFARELRHEYQQIQRMRTGEMQHE